MGQNQTQLLDYAGLACLLGRTTGAIRQDSTRRPHTLPPQVRLPGKGCRWRMEDVQQWLASLVVPTPPPPVKTIPASKKLGRPTKVESIKRAAAKSVEGAAD